ncbi:MAG: hypothetical protein JNM17_00095 [Archangium sp.]|nr:hypothetical protein [Archangium sp.]
MPCPASLEEQAQARLDYTLPQLQARLRVLVPHLALIRHVATRLHAQSPLDDPEMELAHAWSLAEKFDAGGAMPVFDGPRPKFTNDVPDEEDIKRQEAEETWLTSHVREAELAACILGCALTRRLRGAATLEPDAEKALGAHREHRDADRAARLATLEVDLQRAATPSSGLIEAKKKLEALSGPRLYEVRRSIFS